MANCDQPNDWDEQNCRGSERVNQKTKRKRERKKRLTVQ